MPPKTLPSTSRSAESGSMLLKPPSSLWNTEIIKIRKYCNNDPRQQSFKLQKGQNLTVLNPIFTNFGNGDREEPEGESERSLDMFKLSLEELYPMFDVTFVTMVWLKWDGGC